MINANEITDLMGDRVIEAYFPRVGVRVESV